MLTTALSALLAVCLAALLPAQETGATKLPKTEAGRRVAAYFKAFNSGDESAMREFIAGNVPPEALRQRPVEARIARYRELREEFGRLATRRVLAASANEVTVLAATERGGWLEMSFQFEPQPPHRLLGLRVEDTEPPAGEAPAAKTRSDAAAKMSEPEAVAAIEKLLDGLVKADEFSGTLLVAKNGRPIFQRACGLASKEHNVPNRLDTKFNLGSINKVFTQIAIGQLIEQGKLSLDDTLGQHLTDYPNRDAAAKVTVRHLLSMSSGIGDFFGPKFEAMPKDRLRKVGDYLPLFAAEPLHFEPGTRRQYSNGGYIVLGAIIERVSGRDYYDYVREHVFRPAGMQDTDWYEADAPIANLAAGYTRAGGAGGRRSNIYTRPAKGSPAGGGYSTAEDLLKFAAALEAGKLRIPVFDEQAGRDEKNGQKGFKGLGAAGGAPGINAILMVNPASGYTIIVLSNYDPPGAESVGKQIRGLLARVGS